MSEEPASVFPLGASVAGRRYLVYGLARSGLATVRALLAAGASVVGWDERLEAREAAANQNLLGTGRGTSEAGGGVASCHDDGDKTPPLHHPPLTASPTASSGAAGGPPPRSGEVLQFADPLTIDLSTFAGIVVSPGIPINRHPIAAAARAAKVPLIGDIELFALARPSLPPHKVVGITGTNGKSTTTALVHHILKVAGVPTTMGGNIGIPILSQPALPEGGVYVLELSSYQIDLTFSLDCDVAVLLNITPDHLDRYANFEAYAAAKVRLFAMQTAGHNSVTSVCEAMEYSVLDAGPGGVVASFIEDTFDFKEKWSTQSQKNWPALQGPHNRQNGMAAVEVCDILGLDHDLIEAGLRTYPGLPHRMERVGEIDGVLYVNDSKATNAASAAPALAAYPPAPARRIHWIVGGLAKGEGIGECAPFLGHVAHAYLIGEASEMLARTLDGHLDYSRSGTLAAATAAAHAAAKPGDVVLLSPAAASFDQFRDFEHRGDAFRATVASLTPQQEPAR